MSKEVLVCGFSDTLSIAQSVAKSTKSLYSPIKSDSFPDGESLVRLVANPHGKIVVIISSMGTSPDSKLVRTLLAGSIARDNGAKKVILIATYLPYLRQDKVFNSYESFSAKKIMGLLCDTFDSVIAVDPHLHRVDSLREYSTRASEVSTTGVITDYLRGVKGDFVIVGPDEESYQWSKTIAKTLGKEVHVLIKNRSSSSKVSVAGENFSLKGKNAVIIDDIISTGHTISQSLKLIKERGAKKIICIGVHGLLAGDSVKLITKYADLVTTNTVISKFSKIDISPLIADIVSKLR
jgi:ribose-phosphate pyrophosphokinase